jgi:peptidoglycan hydrolase-like protein with peptidoglycan-binding domain
MTVKQSQLLLSYLGYYKGQIDGVSGSQTQDAIRRFQKEYGLTVDGVFGAKTEAKIREVIGDPTKEKKQETSTVVNTQVVNKPTTGDAFWDRIKYFTRDEFACKCKQYGKAYCNGYPVEPSQKLVNLAEKVRAHFNAPITVSSGIRCKQHNINQGGVANSRHTLGTAMDFAVTGRSSAQVLAYVETLSEVAYCYPINDSYVHMDVI